MKLHLLSPIFLLLALGCGAPNPDEEPLDAAKPEVQTFEGEVDAKLVGAYATADKRQQLDLKADGTANMKNKVSTPGGEQNVDVDVEWKTKDAQIAFKKQDGSVQKYGFEVKGNELILKSTKSSTTYVKSK